MSTEASSSSSSSPTTSIFFFINIIFVLASLTRAQNNNTTQPITDTSEVKALNLIFEKWNIKGNTKQWNISGNPCSGAAIDDSDLDDVAYNPFIKCDCSFNNASLCHITKLKVYAMENSVVGPIPEELWTLTYLNNLNLGQNYLSGTLSPSIGNLTRMQYLNFGINELSGKIPKELGQLTELISLSFSSNNFFGPLPSELGNLTKLEQLYMSSSGVSGEIPSSFSKLKNLKTLWALDNEFTGKIPDFIGSWTKLAVLRLQGNSFEGPIPSTFSNLTSLSELRVSDLSNGSSSLKFIKGLKSLSILVLRNNNISDSIPPNIGEYQNLTQLDLSFNNLVGQIPDSLFNLSSLSMLFLGNNKINGTLPKQKVHSLLNVDVSFNNLVGTFPSWVNKPNLHINLVGNNFTIESSNNSGILSGLKCLQRNFPCNHDRPIYYSFGINCGGPQIKSSDNILYETDNETLGPASYFVTKTNRWAVSNVGYFNGINNAQYTTNSLSQFTRTLDTELFQTSRLSASSLRYYGLGLENGNYTVKLLFSETAILDPPSWKSLGRRVFDIYIQGSLVLKNFDIRKEAGHVSFGAVEKVFTTQVSENYLEVHLFWAGKGTCCIPKQGTYGPSISAISATADFDPTVSNKPPSSKKNRTGLIVGILVGVVILSSLMIFMVSYTFQRRKKSQMIDSDDFLGMDVRPFTFSYAELKMATNNFDSANKLGEGGFGPVYKGSLDDGRVIAVKQLSMTSHQGKSQFVAEIATISAVQHRNLIKLHGCCIEGGKQLLVYEYLENKSLDQALFGNNSLKLDWSTRFDICLGIAKGLAYLHEESRLRIVHRDVKASNILLDSNLNPKISDFGLAKLYDDNKTHISTHVAGTIGYLAPEYAMRGHLTEKADVFAFGVVALETISGRPNSAPNLEEEQIYLLGWAWNLQEQNNEADLVDSELSEFDEDEVRRLIRVALLCTQTSPTSRPSMSRVVAMLSGDIEVSTEISRPGYLADWSLDILSSILSDVATIGTDSTYYDSPASTSMVGDALPSPAKGATRPILQSCKSKIS
ncbi:probable LRR receptor-like serine/threonine-protein kinase At1g56140 [Humulus lupulus]|uniref:probable LRR receptor-like serine/threonine-protein kinase At1g56140 n=1 Tax=Humulus lupulus TaxID=3486 RepID=UPI002B40B49F|nr:probable LRR receptor-like serine/threonine-protein kinase At1g56140 [Humulus lupulus]